VRSGQQFSPDADVAAAIDQAPRDRLDAKEMAPRQPNAESAVATLSGFRLTSANGWTIEAVESIAREEPEAA